VTTSILQARARLFFPETLPRDESSGRSIRDSLTLRLGVFAESDWGRGRGRLLVGGGDGGLVRRATIVAEPGAVAGYSLSCRAVVYCGRWWAMSRLRFASCCGGGAGDL
jgi:hypothetical protein